MLQKCVRIKVLVLVLLALLIPCWAEEPVVKFVPPTLCRRCEFEVKVVDKTFQEYEKFDLTSNRIRSFATGWAQWRQICLQDDDLLCYVPELRGNPFGLIFFERGVEDNYSFEVRGSLLFRNGEVYGASVHDDESYSTALEHAKSIRYMFHVGRFEPAGVERFDKLKYLCFGAWRAFKVT